MSDKLQKMLDEFRAEVAVARAERKELEARIEALQRGKTPARGKR